MAKKKTTKRAKPKAKREGAEIPDDITLAGIHLAQSQTVAEGRPWMPEAFDDLLEWMEKHGWEGDEKTRKMIDDYRASIDRAAADSLLGLLRDLERTRRGDIEAIQRMASTHFTEGRVLKAARQMMLEPKIRERKVAYEDHEDAFEDGRPSDAWWTDITHAALSLIAGEGELDETPVTDLYRTLRNKMRVEVEKNLTEGTTTDSDEFQTATILDVPSRLMGDSDDSPGPYLGDDNGLFEILIDGSYWGDPGFYRAPDLTTPLSKIADARVKKIKALLTPEEFRIVTCGQHPEDAKALADELGLTMGNFYVKRHRALEKLRKLLKNPEDLDSLG